MMSGTVLRPCLLRLLVLMGLLSVFALGEEAAAAADSAEADGGEADETKELLSKLTITMVSEVIDARTLEIRDAKATGGRKKAYIRLGNIALPERGAGASDTEHEEKLAKGKAELEKLVGKQMIWFKAAADEHQPAEEGGDAVPVIIADAWMLDGRHLGQLLTKEGHVKAEEIYQEELARNILSAEADEAKQESYKKLEEALRESEMEKRKQVEEEQRAERMKNEPIGFAGMCGLSVLGFIVLGAIFNFGRSSKKKVNLNRKKGFFEKIWSKVKGA